MAQRVVIATALLCSFLVGSHQPAKAATFRYPGSDGCRNTLQRCINNVPHRSTIVLDTDRTIKQNIRITKSLTLKTARGARPVIEPRAHGFDGFTVHDGGRTHVDVRIDGLVLKGSPLEVTFDEGSQHDFTLTNSRITHSVPGANGVDFFTEVPASVLLRSNVIRARVTGLDIQAVLAAGEMAEVRAIGNELTTLLPSGSNSGITAEAIGSGATFLGRFHSNLIHRVGATLSFPGGIVMINKGPSSTYSVVNNTIDDTRGGAGMVGSFNSGSMEIFAFNNSVSNGEGSPYSWPPLGGGTTVVSDFNNFYNFPNPPNTGGHTAGPNTTSVNPRYKSRPQRNYRLRPASGLIDAGEVCNLGGLQRVDADGDVRFLKGLGSSVDVGAYETASTTLPPGKAISGSGTVDGTNGHDVICGSDSGDVIKAMDGNDWVDALGGEDTVRTGKGADLGYGGPAGDQLLAGPGIESLFGQDGNDNIVVDDGNPDDLAHGGPDTDLCASDPGDDRRQCETSAPAP